MAFLHERRLPFYFDSEYPAHHLEVVDSALSSGYGITCIEDVPAMICLMKKSSSILEHYNVYCYALQRTKPDMLSQFLDKGGWPIIYTWLQHAKSSSSDIYLIQLLKLCKWLPMTVNRLKENCAAKLVKNLMRHSNCEVKDLASEVVKLWLSVIKMKKSSETTGLEVETTSLKNINKKISTVDKTRVVVVAQNEENSENIDSSNIRDVPVITTKGNHTSKETELRQPFVSDISRSILCHAKMRKSEKKNVNWAKDIKKVFYFERDHMERVNVSTKSKKEKMKKSDGKLLKMASRQASNKVDEFAKNFISEVNDHVPSLLNRIYAVEHSMMKNICNIESVNDNNIREGRIQLKNGYSLMYDIDTFMNPFISLFSPTHIMDNEPVQQILDSQIPNLDPIIMPPDLSIPHNQSYESGDESMLVSARDFSHNPLFFNQAPP